MIAVDRARVCGELKPGLVAPRSSVSSGTHNRLRSFGAVGRLPAVVTAATVTTLATFAVGWRFYRGHGGAVRRARGFCQIADLLELRRPRDWQRRARRLYQRAARDLAPAVAAADDADTQASDPQRPPDPAARARQLLRAAEAPYRRTALALGATAAALGASVALVVVIGCWISPALRTRLFPPDLAAHAPWVASSAVAPNPIRGVGPHTARLPLFFHTQSSDHPWIEIDLGAPRTIRSLRVENREDCCQASALPLNLEIFDESLRAWRIVTQRRAGFDVWTRSFAPERVRRVRLRLAGSGVLHLKRIALYQW
jgi:hypothetical protein